MVWAAYSITVHHEALVLGFVKSLAKALQRQKGKAGAAMVCTLRVASCSMILHLCPANMASANLITGSCTLPL